MTLNLTLPRTYPQVDKLRVEREAMHKHVTKIQAHFRARLERKRDPLGRIRANRRRVEEIWEALKASDAVLEKEAKLHQDKVRCGRRRGRSHVTLPFTDRDTNAAPDAEADAHPQT